MVKDASRLVLDLDIVAHVLPVENSLLSLDTSGLMLARFVRLLRGANGRAGLEIVGVVMSLTATEEQNFTLRLGLRDVLGGGQVGEHEKHHKSDHNTQVPPLVTLIVLEALSKIRGSIDVSGTSNRPDLRANLVCPVGVSIAGWDKFLKRTRECPAVELVDHQTFKTVSDRVNVVHPSRPAKHVSRGNGETGVDDQTENENCSGHQSLGQTARGRSDRTEQHRHGQGSDEREEQEREESARLLAKTSHEIERDVEDDGITDFVGHIT